MKMKEVDHYELELHQYQMDRQKELLCTGKTFRVSQIMKTFFVILKFLNLLFYFQNASETKDLKCFYGHNNSPWLRLGPIKLEVQNKSPYIAVLREILFSHECDNITSFLSPFLGTPPGRMKGGTGKNDWTMKKYESKFVTLRVELIPVLPEIQKLRLYTGCTFSM